MRSNFRRIFARQPAYVYSYIYVFYRLLIKLIFADINTFNFERGQTDRACVFYISMRVYFCRNKLAGARYVVIYMAHWQSIPFFYGALFMSSGRYRGDFNARKGVVSSKMIEVIGVCVCIHYVCVLTVMSIVIPFR